LIACKIFNKDLASSITFLRGSKFKILIYWEPRGTKQKKEREIESFLELGFLYNLNYVKNKAQSRTKFQDQFGGTIHFSFAAEN
jgi:hypothetical protein